GGMQQKWANAYDEALRVPMVVKGPGIAASVDGIEIPTSHVDLIPTLLGLVGADVEAAAAALGANHTEVRPLPGRDLSDVLTGTTAPAGVAAPVYFMTEDDVTRGVKQRNLLTGEPFDAIDALTCIESVVAPLPTGPDGAPELWKLNHYHEGLRAWHADRGATSPNDRGLDADPEWELHNLTADPEERTNLEASATDAKRSMQAILESERDTKRLLPS
ncbi:MAG: sulfatase-like hydrolase/transferase, partial [Acidimicrobiales bacterium]|nr:sulfatase-like hydrolase/transferase [Acidimicrobiales bacterium]